MARGDPFPGELRPDGPWGFVLRDSSHGFVTFNARAPGRKCRKLRLSGSSHGFGRFNRRLP